MIRINPPHHWAGELPDRLTEIKALKERPIILVCRATTLGQCSAILRDANFRGVSVLRGMEQWNAQTGCRVKAASGSGVEATAHEGASKVTRFLNPIVAAAGAATVVVPTWVWAQAPSGTPDYGYGPHMMWGFGMIFGPLFFILVLALVIAVAVLLVRWLAGPWQAASHPAPPGRTPLDILKER